MITPCVGLIPGASVACRRGAVIWKSPLAQGRSVWAVVRNRRGEWCSADPARGPWQRVLGRARA